MIWFDVIFSYLGICGQGKATSLSTFDHSPGSNFCFSSSFQRSLTGPGPRFTRGGISKESGGGETFVETKQKRKKNMSGSDHNQMDTFHQWVVLNIILDRLLKSKCS
jgi:hypothetical protein